MPFTPLQPAQPQAPAPVQTAPKPGFKPATTSGFKPYVPPGSQNLTPESPKSFRFKDVPEPVKLPTQRTPEEKAKRVADLKAAEEAAKKEADKGLFGRTVKEVGNVITSSEQALGQTIAKVIDDETVNTRTENIAKLTDSNLKILKKIAENTKAGRDSTNLKREFNRNADVIEQNGGDLSAYEASLPTTLQAIGQLGGVALDVLTAGTYGKSTAPMKSFNLAPKPGTIIQKGTQTILPKVGKVTEIASKPAGLFTKKGVTNVAKGAGVGYATDVTEGLMGHRGEDREGANAFIPGMGTLIGGTLPALTETAQSFKNRASGAIPDTKVNKIVTKRERELDKVILNNKSVKKVVEKAEGRGIKVKRLLAETDLLHNAVDETGTIRTQEAMAELDDFIRPQEDVISKTLAIEGKKISLDLVREKLTKAVDDSGLEGGALERALREVEDDIAGYSRRADPDGMITVSKVHEAKVDKYSNINYMNPESKKSGKVIAKALKELVEENTQSADVKKLNGELSAHFAVLDLLDKLDGKKVQGGKLGKYFAQTIGGIAGSHFGPLGTIIGSEVAGRIKGSNMSKTFNGVTGKALQQSDAMKAAVKAAEDYTPPPKQPMKTNLPKKAAAEATETSAKARAFAPKTKGEAIQVNNYQGDTTFIPKKSVLENVRMMRNKKPSSLIKINKFDAPEYPSYIQRYNKRMWTYLESKKNAGKPVDMKLPSGKLRYESIPKVDGTKIRVKEKMASRAKDLPKPWTIDMFPPEALEVNVNGKWQSLTAVNLPAKK